MSAPAPAKPAEEEKIEHSNDHIRREILNAGSVKRKHNRILVTGGCGFIGSHLIDRLLQDENNVVICADNCFSGSKSNIAHHLNNPRFEFMRQDVTEPFLVEVDEIYHLACPASPVFYQNKSATHAHTHIHTYVQQLLVACWSTSRLVSVLTHLLYLCCIVSLSVSVSLRAVVSARSRRTCWVH